MAYLEKAEFVDSKIYKSLHREYIMQSGLIVRSFEHTAGLNKLEEGYFRDRGAGGLIGEHVIMGVEERNRQIDEQWVIRPDSIQFIYPGFVKKNNLRKSRFAVQDYLNNLGARFIEKEYIVTY